MHASLTALIEILASIELADESEISTDFAVRLQEEAASVFQALPTDARRDVVERMRVVAQQATVPARAAIIAAMPEAFGLLE